MLGWSWTDYSVLDSQLFEQASVESCGSWLLCKGKTHFIWFSPKICIQENMVHTADGFSFKYGFNNIWCPPEKPLLSKFLRIYIFLTQKLFRSKTCVFY